MWAELLEKTISPEMIFVIVHGQFRIIEPAHRDATANGPIKEK